MIRNLLNYLAGRLFLRSLRKLTYGMRLLALSSKYVTAVLSIWMDITNTLETGRTASSGTLMSRESRSTSSSSGKKETLAHDAVYREAVKELKIVSMNREQTIPVYLTIDKDYGSRDWQPQDELFEKYHGTFYARENHGLFTYRHRVEDDDRRTIVKFNPEHVVITTIGHRGLHSKLELRKGGGSIYQFVLEGATISFDVVCKMIHTDTCERDDAIYLGVCFGLNLCGDGAESDTAIQCSETYYMSTKRLAY